MKPHTTEFPISYYPSLPPTPSPTLLPIILPLYPHLTLYIPYPLPSPIHLCSSHSHFYSILIPSIPLLFTLLLPYWHHLNYPTLPLTIYTDNPAPPTLPIPIFTSTSSPCLTFPPYLNSYPMNPAPKSKPTHYPTLSYLTISPHSLICYSPYFTLPMPTHSLY